MGKTRAVLARDAEDLQGKDGYKHRFAFKVMRRSREHLYVYSWVGRPTLKTDGSWNESHPVGNQIRLCQSGIHAFDTLEQLLDGGLDTPKMMLEQGTADLWLVELAGERIARDRSKCAARFCRFVFKFQMPDFGWNYRGLTGTCLDLIAIHDDLTKQFNRKFWKPRRGKR